MSVLYQNIDISPKSFLQSKMVFILTPNKTNYVSIFQKFTLIIYFLLQPTWLGVSSTAAGLLRPLISIMSIKNPVKRRKIFSCQNTKWRNNFDIDRSVGSWGHFQKETFQVNYNCSVKVLTEVTVQYNTEYRVNYNSLSLIIDSLLFSLAARLPKTEIKSEKYILRVSWLNFEIINKL